MALYRFFILYPGLPSRSRDRTYHDSRFIFVCFFSLIFLFVPCGGLSWLFVSLLLHVKYTVSHRLLMKLIAVTVDEHTHQVWSSCSCPLDTSLNLSGIQCVDLVTFLDLWPLTVYIFDGTSWLQENHGVSIHSSVVAYFVHFWDRARIRRGILQAWWPSRLTT